MDRMARAMSPARNALAGRARSTGQGPVGGVIPHPAGVPAQHCFLMPDHQQLGALRLVPAEHEDKQPE
jgi:hypothetical protein